MYLGNKNTARAEVFAYKLNGKMYLNLTNQCCCSCDFCIRKIGDGVAESTLWLTREPQELEVLAQIAALEASGFEYSEVVFCGYGEPTYAMRLLFNIGKILRERGKKVRLDTNGLGNLINDSDIVPALSQAIDTVSISINAPDGWQYQKMCRSKFGLFSFEAILDFAKTCVETNIPTTLTVLDILPKTEIDKCRSIARDLNADFRVREYVGNNYNYDYLHKPKKSVSAKGIEKNEDIKG